MSAFGKAITRTLAGALLSGVFLFCGASPARAGQDPLLSAEQCAGLKAKGKDQFAGCWIHEMASPQQKHVLTCWDDSPHAVAQFALCSSHVRLTETDKRLVGCIGSRRGDINELANCVAGGALNPDQ